MQPTKKKLLIDRFLKLASQRDIGVALDLAKQSIEISNQYRRKTTLTESFGRILKKTDYNSYTEGSFWIS